MSQPCIRRHIYDDAQDAELAKWPGVTWARQVRSKHLALVLTFGGVSRFVIYPMTPGDSTRGALNHLRDVRQTLAAMGAKRSQPVRATQPRRARNRTEPRRVDLGERTTGGPCRDPWAALKDWTPPPPQPAPQPPPAPSLWQRIKATIAKLGRDK